MLKYNDEIIGIGHVDLSNYAKQIDIDKINNQVFSKNLLNLDKLANGWLQEDGTESPSTQGNYVTEYIEIEGGETYFLSRVHGVSSSICWYDKDKNYISGHAYNSIRDFSITAPSNAKYTRLTVQIAYANEMMLEKGSTQSAYTPYAKSNSEITNDIEQKEREITDLKMLGWTVPKECPIQNYYDSASRVFHQRVGRIDLGSLTWGYGTYVTDTWNYTLSDYKSDGITYTVNYDKTIWSAAIQSGQYMTTDNHIVINNGSSTTKPSGYLYYELAAEIVKSDGNEINNTSMHYAHYDYTFSGTSSSGISGSYYKNNIALSDIITDFNAIKTKIVMINAIRPDGSTSNGVLTFGYDIDNNKCALHVMANNIKIQFTVIYTD